MQAEYALSVHDVAPDTWVDCERLLALADPVGAPATLLVVPHYHGGRRIDDDARFAAALRRRVSHGDEVVLHGYWHQDRGPRPRSPADWFRRRVSTASEGEFAAVDRETASDLIARGQALLAAAGLAPAGFVAPAWLMSEATLDALAGSGLRYASVRRELIDLATRRRLAAPSLVYSTRSIWRRAASHWWNASRIGAWRAEPRIRVALHPADVRHGAVLGDWRRLLGALAASRTPVLESSWLP